MNESISPSPAEPHGSGGTFAVEQHGSDPIPDSERHMRLRDLGLFWVATNLYVFNFSLGVIAYSFGLSLIGTIVALGLGNLTYVLVALGSISGMRSGVPTLVITAASFGRHLNRVNSFLAWLLGVAFEVVNVVFGTYATVELFKALGWADPGTPGTVAALLAVMAISVVVAYLGHRAVLFVQKVFAVVLTAVMVLVAIETLPSVDWSAVRAGGSDPSIAIGTWLLAAGVIGAAGLAYMQIPADYPRYMPSDSSARGVFWTVLIAAGGTAFLLAVMGAVLASRGDLSDPIAGVRPMVPEWMFILFVVAVIGGSIGNNLITLYSSAFAVQTIGVPLKRYQATLMDGALALALVCYVLFVAEGILSLLNSMVALFAIWIGPFAGVWIADAVLRRHDYRWIAASAHRDTAPHLRIEAVSRRGLIAFAAGAAMAALTMNAPIYQGPLSEAILDGGDGAWIFGPLVAAVVYWLTSVAGLRAAAEQRSESASHHRYSGAPVGAREGAEDSAIAATPPAQGKAVE